MEGTRQSDQGASPERRYREQPGEPVAGADVLPAGSQLPLEVCMTDEPGGDPYNHTGSFKRVFR
jgi:hypothetical protein